MENQKVTLSEQISTKLNQKNENFYSFFKLHDSFYFNFFFLDELQIFINSKIEMEVDIKNNFPILFIQTMENWDHLSNFRFDKNKQFTFETDTDLHNLLQTCSFMLRNLIDRKYYFESYSNFIFKILTGEFQNFETKTDLPKRITEIINKGIQDTSLKKDVFIEQFSITYFNLLDILWNFAIIYNETETDIENEQSLRSILCWKIYGNLLSVSSD